MAGDRSGAGGADSAAVILVVGTFRVAAERLAEARAAMGRMVASSRAEAGCLGYVYAEDLFDPGLIHVVERWEGWGALERHFGSAHIAEWREVWAGLGIGGRELVGYEVTGERRV